MTLNLRPTRYVVILPGSTLNVAELGKQNVTALNQLSDSPMWFIETPNYLLEEGDVSNLLDKDSGLAKIFLGYDQHVLKRQNDGGLSLELNLR